MVFLLGCKKQEIDQPPASEPLLVISTDQLTYAPDEQMTTSITNNCENPIQYYSCAPSFLIRAGVWKYENDEWISYWVTICNAGPGSYCCKEIEAATSYNETTLTPPEAGIYKMVYNLILEEGGDYEIVFSNEFEVE